MDNFKSVTFYPLKNEVLLNYIKTQVPNLRGKKFRFVMLQKVANILQTPCCFKSYWLPIDT